MSKATRRTDEHAAQLARVRRICSELDDLRVESERLREITSEVRRPSDAAPPPEFSRIVPSKTPVPAAARRDARAPEKHEN